MKINNRYVRLTDKRAYLSSTCSNRLNLLLVSVGLQLLEPECMFPNAINF
jgi:hypothetical protein